MSAVPFTILIGLAKAREFLLLDAAISMPEAGAQQRRRVLASLEDLIGREMADRHEPLPAPSSREGITGQAWDYLAQATSPAAQEFAAPYAHLQATFTARSHLSLTAEVLDWLQQCRASLAGEALAFSPQDMEDASVAVEYYAHRLLDSPVVASWMDAATVHAGDLSPDHARNFELMQHIRLRTVAEGGTLVQALKKATLASHIAWEKARHENRFEDWLPHFEEIFALTLQKGQALALAFHVSAYQALVDERNPDLKLATIDRLFGQLRASLPALINEVLDRQSSKPAPLSLPEVAPERQHRLALAVMGKLGLDPAHARLDESAHPFSTGYLDDVRITTRYRAHDMLSGLMAIIHETGHALYSQHLPRDWQNQPLGQDQSMWIHESQSLFWEMQVARSKAFMRFLAPVIHETLGVEGPEWSAENLYALSTRVRRSLIRVEADEVTYPAHVLLRHGLESRLVAGSLAPRDVPGAWAAGMQELLQVEVPDDAHGCLQDVHWPEGLFGYFPAYTLGALASAQLMQKLKTDLPGMTENVERGQFTPIRQWLSEHIHSQGSRYDGEELIARATGAPLGIEAWLRHIQARYLGSA